MTHIMYIEMGNVISSLTKKLTYNVDINKGSSVKGARAPRACAHTHTHTHAHAHAHTLYRLIKMKDSIANLKYSEKRNVLSLFLKEERVALKFQSLSSHLGKSICAPSCFSQKCSPALPLKLFQCCSD